MAELDRVVAMIAETPARWPEHWRETRRVRLRRFPYYVLYRVQAEEILVVAIAHRRKPGYWQRRR